MILIPDHHSPSFDVLFPPDPFKSQSAEQQVEIATDPDPVDAANSAVDLPNVAGNTQGNDNTGGDIIFGDGDSSHYPWNAGT